MNPSRLFILRPVATSLLMAAILLVGVVAFRFLPLSALPEVDYPTIQVQTFYPGASPEVMTSSVTAPLERQFGQMPGLNQMSSASSAGASVITLQFSLDLSLDVAEQEVQAAINAAGNLLPADLPAPPIYAKVNPADAPILTLGADLEDDAADRRSRTWPTPGWRRRSRSCRASAWSASAAASGRPCASRPTRARWPPTASTSTTCAPRSATPTSTRRRAISTARRRPTRSTPTTSSPDADDYANLVDRLPQRRAGAAVATSPTWSTAPENTKLGAWTNTTPAIILNIQRQPGANVIEVVDSIKALLPQLQRDAAGGGRRRAC